MFTLPATSPPTLFTQGASVECEAPNARLYNFTGNLLLPDGSKVPLSTAAVLLRGCSLRNTAHAYGGGHVCR